MKKDKNHSFEETNNQNVEVINLTEIYDDESEDSFLQDNEELDEAVDEDIIIEDDIEDNTEDDTNIDNLPDDEEAEIVVDDLEEAIEENIDIKEDIEDDDDQIITLSNIYKEVSNVYKEADVDKEIDKEIDKETNQEVAKKEDAIIIKFENNSLSIDEEKIEKILYDVVKKHFFENVADKMEKIIEKTLLDEIEKMEKILTEIKLS